MAKAAIVRFKIGYWDFRRGTVRGGAESGSDLFQANEIEAQRMDSRCRDRMGAETRRNQTELRVADIPRTANPAYKHNSVSPGRRSARINANVVMKNGR